MRFSNYVSGILLGSIMTGFFTSQCHRDEVLQINREHTTEVTRMREDHQTTIGNLEDVDEACAELFERNMELETAAVVLNQKVMQAEVNCLWRLRQAEKERCQ